MIPAPQNDHWFILSIGTLARTLEAGLSFLTVYTAVMFWEHAQTTIHNSAVLMLIVVALTFVLNLVLVLAHEMGHALAAWSVGRRVHLICVGLLGFIPTSCEFVWVNQPKSAEYAGFVQSSPIWPDFNRAKSIWVSLGGPLITFIMGITIMVLASHSVYYKLPTQILGIFFLLDAFINLLPLRWSQDTSSDGLHIWQYLTRNLWTPDSWAETRLGVANRTVDIVSEKEWAKLRPLVKQPFYGGSSFRQLLFVSALEKNDLEMLEIIGKMQKLSASKKQPQNL